MADVQNQHGSAPAPRGKPRAKQTSTRIDFTPMVDLGFLLITFFMLTTALSKPSMMPLVMPKDDGTTEPQKESKVLTVLLGAADKIYWYEGLNLDKMDSTAFDSDGLRQLILLKKEKVSVLPSKKKK